MEETEQATNPGKYQVSRTELARVADDLAVLTGMKTKRAQAKVAEIVGFGSWHQMRGAVKLGFLECQLTPLQILNQALPSGVEVQERPNHVDH